MPKINASTMTNFVTNVLPTFYPVVLLGGNDAAPAAVKPYTISASFTGSDTTVGTALNGLTLRQAINLLSQFTFKLTPGTASYAISGSAPNLGTAASNGGTFDTVFGNLCLSDLGQLLSQVTFTVGGSTSYQISGQPESGIGSEFVTFVQEEIGRRSAGYLGIGLSLMQFTIKKTAPVAGTPVGFSVITNKNHGE